MSSEQESYDVATVDAFESLIATLLRRDGWWVERSVRAGMRALSDSKGWLLWDDQEIRRRVEACCGDGYENDPVVVAAKVLMRHGGARAVDSGR